MDRFAELVRLALYGIGKTKVLVGGIEFWFVKGALVYSHPSSTWDVDAVSAELTRLVKAGLERANRAIK